MAGYVSPERKALQTKANIFVVLGIVLSLGTRAISFPSQAGAAEPSIPQLGLLMVVGIASLVCWIIGLSAYAQSKGYSKWYALLGFLSCCGLIILVILPNKWIESGPGGYGPGDYPRPNG